MINYILQVLLFQALFLAVYDFFLQKETFFKWNRIYLLATPFLSFLIPFLKFESIQQTVPQEYLIQLPTVFLNPQVAIEQTIANQTSFNYVPFIFIGGMIIFTFIFIIRLFKILNLINSNKIVKNEHYNLVILKEKQSAFSFFNYIFINKHLVESKDLKIVQHELVHCKQLHSVDLLLFEILKIILWFNPLIYVYQKRITLLHEYISDAEVVKQTNKKSYFNTLLSETFNVENITFINQFYKQSFIKKRIAMITKNRSKEIKQLKYLLIVPLLFGMLILSSFEKTDTELENELPLKTDESSIFEFSPLEKKLNISLENSKDNEIKKGTQKIDFKNIDTITANDVPFAKIENVPVFPGCEGTEEELRICLQENITMHVNKNFNSKMTKSLGLSSGVKRIFVMFSIDKEGNINEVKAKAPHQSLADEAIRVVNLLPQMIPGKHQGENVGVKYSLPIAFKVE